MIDALLRSKLFQQFLRKSLSLGWGPVVQIHNRLEQLFVSPLMANVWLGAIFQRRACTRYFFQRSAQAARALLDINLIWFGYIARISQWEGGGILLVQIISTCLRCACIGRGGGVSTLWLYLRSLLTTCLFPNSLQLKYKKYNSVYVCVHTVQSPY